MSYVTPELVEAVTARHYELAGVPVPGQGRRPYAARHHRPRQARRRNTRRSRRHRPPRRPPAVTDPGWWTSRLSGALLAAGLPWQ